MSLFIKWAREAQHCCRRKLAGRSQHCSLNFLLFIALLAGTGAVRAAENVLLIQMRPDGHYTIWHNEGKSRLTDEDVVRLDGTEKPEGGPATITSAGLARAYQTANGVTIRLAAAQNYESVLIDRDNCGHIRLWHSDGKTDLSEDEITDIVMSALPEGGKRLTIGNRYAKAYLTKLGVTAVLWSGPQKTGG